MPRVFAVVVTYEPDEALLSILLNALIPQVTGAIVINNGCHLPLSEHHLQSSSFVVQHLEFNAGVAAALNAGFQWAQTQDAEFVITFDQDSEPAPDMVERLFVAYQNLVATGQKVGAVGPQQLDRRTGQRAAFMAPILRRRLRIMPGIGETVEVDHLITSGCLVPMNAWHDVGTFMDSLFIDYVDIEWSLRLRHRGWHLFGVEGAVLTHSIGDNIKSWLGWRFPWHSPLRHYFQFRNGIYLQTLPHISIGWKISDSLQLMKKLIIFTLVGRPRITHFRAMLHGIRHGWHGKLGPAKDI